MQGVMPSVMGGSMVFKAGPESSRSLVTQLQKLETCAYRVAVREDEGIYRDPITSQTPCL